MPPDRPQGYLGLAFSKILYMPRYLRRNKSCTLCMSPRGADHKQSNKAIVNYY